MLEAESSEPMNITIKNTQAGQSFFAANNLKWKLYRKPIIRLIVVACIIGLAAIIFGTMSRDEYSWYVSTPGSARYVNFHFTETFGYVILFFVSIGILYFIRFKKVFFTRVKAFSDQLLNSSNETLIQITDSEISYSDFQLSQRMQWSLIASYTTAEHYIFLNYGTTVLAALTIDSRLMQKHELEELTAFLKNRMAHIK